MDYIMRGKKLIEDVDLSDVIDRLIHVDGWKKKYAIEACKDYRKFLFLKLKYGKHYELPPSDEIDDVWHAHILHTEDYMNFCNEVFGYYLHHHPHNKRAKLSNYDLEMMFENETQKLYKQEFGDYIYSIKPVSLKRKVAGILKRLTEVRAFYQQSTKA